jgi:hypothetical protein
MLPRDIFQIDMALGYLAWALCIATYVWPRLRAMDRVEAHRAIATFNSFGFFGLAFLLPGFVGPRLPQGFAMPVAYGDLALSMRVSRATAAANPAASKIRCGVSRISMWSPTIW